MPNSVKQRYDFNHHRLALLLELKTKKEFSNKYSFAFDFFTQYVFDTHPYLYIQVIFFTYSLIEKFCVIYSFRLI